MLFLEGISLIIILIFQFRSYWRSILEIAELKALFPVREIGQEAVIVTEVNGQSVEQLDINHSNSTFKMIIAATNAYLGKNKGSADFNIIKSIADRSTESQENKVSSSLSLPLYLGLMGTFIGVILGLASIAVNGFNLNDTDFIIKELISGVVLAMIVSLIGLALTTNLNARIFKTAIVARDVNRNRYLNFLQAELLPNLDNNLYSALDQFRANMTDFNQKFSKNLSFFDSSFNENIKNLKATVTGMSTQIEVVNRNTAVQLEFLQELKKIGYNRMAEANLRVFDKIKEVGPTLVNFISEQQKLTKNMEQANLFSERITGLMDRVSTFENGVNNLGRDIQQSDLLGGELIGVVKKHLTAIEQKEYLINDYTARSSSEVEGYLKGALERIQLLKNKIELDFEKAFDFDAGNNLMQNLQHLKAIGEHTAGLNEKIEGQSLIGIEGKLDDLIMLLDTRKGKHTKISAPEMESTDEENIQEVIQTRVNWWNRLLGKKNLENGTAV